MRKRNTEISALIVVVVTVIMVRVTKNKFAAEELLDGYTWMFATVAWLAYVGVTSCYKIPADKMLASFFISTLQTTFVTKKYSETKKQMGDNSQVSVIDPQMGGGCGLFDLDFVVLLFPIWRGVYFPTTAIKLIIHATTVYLKEVKLRAEGSTDEVIKSPSVPVKVDVTVLFRLTPNLGPFYQTINVLSKGVRDLAHDAEIHDNLWDPNDEGNGKYAYHGPRITQIVLDALQETILHSVRSVAGQYYSWKEVGVKNTDDAIRDIKSAIPRFQERVILELARPESLLHEAGLLKEGKVNGKKKACFGPATLFFSLVVENITAEDSKFADALAKPMIADLEADADRLRGGGEGERLRKKAKEAGLSVDTVFRGEVLGNIAEVKLISAGDNIVDLAKKLTDQ